MEHDYRNIVSHIDVDRSLDSIEYFDFNAGNEKVQEFKADIESGNDSIELHLIKTNAYKEALILRLKEGTNNEWRELLKEEQKTFGGSKMFYMNPECSKLLVVAVPNEMKTKLNMVVTRLNKVNDKIARINTRIRKENLDLYVSKIKSKESSNKQKDEIINFINQNLRV